MLHLNTSEVREIRGGYLLFGDKDCGARRLHIACHDSMCTLKSGRLGKVTACEHGPGHPEGDAMLG